MEIFEKFINNEETFLKNLKNLWEFYNLINFIYFFINNFVIPDNFKKEEIIRRTLTVYFKLKFKKIRFFINLDFFKSMGL